MVDITGHLAFGLLFAIPAWFLWNRRASVAFVGLAVITSLLPDIDLWLQKLFPGAVHHHGVTHTVLFVTIASIVGGAIVAGLFTDKIDSWIDSERFSAKSLFVFSTVAFWLGGVSHVTADMLSAPDISTPIEPFWPFFDKPWSVDLVWYNAFWINFGFFAVMILLHVALAYWSTPRDHDYRMMPAE
jgi:formate/nitrite transporter FocA (FNT family)